MPLKLNSPNEHQLPMWFANTEILFRDAGIANERVMFNLFRGALTSSQANTWAKFLYDAALTSSPYTHVKNTLKKKPTLHLTTWSLLCSITPLWPILVQTQTLCSFLTLQTSAVALPSCSALTTHGAQSRFSLKVFLLQNASTPRFPENFSDCTLLSNTFVITLREILTWSCTVITNLLWKFFIPATNATTQENVVT